MKSIIKIKLFFFTITSIFLSNFSLAIDPVEIGKMYQKDIEVNLSIIDNLSQNFKGEKIKIEKDIRTQIKKKKNIENKEEVKIDDSIDKKLARIQEMIEEVPNEIHIFFNSETANPKEDDVKKNKKFY